MGRLIDAERRQRILEGFARHLMEAGKVEAAEAVHTLIKGLKLEPTVDAVPVVRCKDCVSYNTKGCASGFGWCEGYDRGMMDYDFCSHGAKMDGDGNG